MCSSESFQDLVVRALLHVPADSETMVSADEFPVQTCSQSGFTLPNSQQPDNSMLSTFVVQLIG